MLDARRLQMLRAVARAGSVSAAARALGYTQPAVSHHIARLEAEVGTALIPRLRAGDADLVLAFSYAAVGRNDGRDLETVALLHDPSHAVVHPAHPAAS